MNTKYLHVKFHGTSYHQKNIEFVNLAWSILGGVQLLGEAQPVEAEATFWRRLLDLFLACY
jgi:hypothetical protein